MSMHLPKGGATHPTTTRLARYLYSACTPACPLSEAPVHACLHCRTVWLKTSRENLRQKVHCCNLSSNPFHTTFLSMHIPISPMHSTALSAMWTFAPSCIGSLRVCSVQLVPPPGSAPPANPFPLTPPCFTHDLTPCCLRTNGHSLQLHGQTGRWVWVWWNGG